jgi:hypothetical protein
MSQSSTPSLTFIGQQITIYVGCIIIVAGVIGELSNIFIFLSLKTFRQSPSGFYLILMSFVDIGQLLFGLFSRVMIYGFGIDWSSTSLAFCKIRPTVLLFCSLTSYTCLCLATIDQYLATCTRLRWQNWSNIKTSYRLIIVFTFIWILYLIPYPILFQLVTSPTTGQVTCTVTSVSMAQYRNYFVSLFLTGYIPDSITVIFAILAYSNIRQIAYRTVPLIRRELDKQLTRIVFVQVLVNLFTNIPCITMNAIIYAVTNTTDPVTLEILQFINTITVLSFYTYFAVSIVIGWIKYMNLDFF